MYAFVHTEMDALTGCKIASIDIGVPVIRMAYSPTSGHAVIAIHEVGALDAFLFRFLDLACCLLRVYC